MAKSQQRLLIDTDAYCKLGAVGLFGAAVAALNLEIEDCGRLPALPYMLRRGRLRQKYGDELSDMLQLHAGRLPIAVTPSHDWLDPLAEIDSIDSGEAQLLAAAAEHELLLLTGDKRALIGVKDALGYAEALSGRVIVLEAILAELCGQLGVGTVRSCIEPLKALDTAIAICFSDSNPSPLAGLLSYHRNLVDELGALSLWRPPSVGGI